MQSRSRLIPAFVAVLLSVGFTAPEVGAKEVASFDMPAQPLVESLRAIASQTNLNVFFEPKLVAGRQAPALRAQVGIEDALRQLLAGSGLTYRHVDEKTFTIVEAAAVSGSRVVPVRSTEAASLRMTQSSPSAVTGEGQAEEQGVGKTSQASLRKTDQDIEEVVVTGTHIRGAADSASPIHVYSREQIDRSGAASVQDFIKRLPQNFNGGASEETIGGVTGKTSSVQDAGGSSINLRGLGSDSTLTLLNGHRLAPGNRTGNFVDVSMIPLNAIDRIEVLTDGASAIYGSDAVGGVVNIILRKNFERPETRLRYGSVSSGNSSQIQIGQSAGLNWSGGSVLLSYEYDDRTPLDASDRDLPTVGAFPAPFSLTPDQRRHGVLLAANHTTESGVELSTNATYARRGYAADSVLLSQNQIARDRADVDVYTANAGVRVPLSERISLGFDSSYSISKQDYRAQTLDLSGAAQPQLVRRNTDTDVVAADLSLDGSVFSTPAGPVRFALGAQFRNESFDQNNALTGNRIFKGDRNILAGYVEMRVPLLAGATASASALELVLADRYENYDDFGSTNNPKIGAIWRPVPSLTLRSTYGTSFKAPLLENLNGQVTSVVALGLADPQAICSCGLTDTLEFFGNNPDLEPEKARTWTFGVEFVPPALEKLRIGANYYDIRYRKRIVAPIESVGFFDALTRENILGPKVINRNPSAAQINALLADPAFLDFRLYTGSSGLPFGAIADYRLQNLALAHTRGVDLALSYITDSSIGNFDIGIDSTYILDFENRFSPASPATDILGTTYNPIDLRVRAHTAWARGPVNLSLFINYTDSYTDNRTGGPDRPISSWTTGDVSLQYAFGAGSGALRGMTALLSVINLTNERPPLVINSNGSPINYDGTNANVLGRFVALQVSRRW